MDYKRLIDLDNQYPNLGNYIKGISENTSVLLGAYPEKNKLDFKLPDISKLKYVSGTNFKFILAIFKTYDDKSPVYYTSELYFKNLQDSLWENNPYFIQQSFNPKNVVSFVCEDIVNLFNSLKDKEISSFVEFRINGPLMKGGAVDYDNLVTYIDWVVDTVSPLDMDNGGILLPETISGWNVLNGNYVENKLTTGISGSFGIGASSVNITQDSVNTNTYELELKAKLDALEKLKVQIAAITNVIETEKGINYEAVFFLFRKAYVVINDVTYETGTKIALKSEKKKEIKNILTESLNLLNKNKIDAEVAVNTATKAMNDAKAMASDAISKAADLANKANDLINKIPKIPKLPKIPKIPKLPSLSDLGSAVLAALPAIPAIPKLPKLPKIPSLKLPPLPKLSFKKPKTPKKIKNQMKGLKGALDSAKGAVSSAQGAVAGAQSAVAGAVSSAQGAVAGAVSSAQSAAMSAVGNINAGMITNVTNVAGGTLTTKTITSAVLGKGETEASILADIAKAAAEAAAHVKQ
jgi:hypothetical protein